MAKKIIIVDDSSTIREQVGQTLAKAGYQVVEAIDGMDGVTKIDANADCAMVICDVNMPRMSGVEMLASVKASGRHPNIAAVMLTTEGDPRLIEQARNAGAKGWLVKPFKPEMLVATVRKIAGPPS